MKIRHFFFGFIFLSAVFVRAGDNYAVYVSNERSGDVSVIDGQIDSVITTIAVGKRPRDVAFAPDSTFAYVSGELDASLYRIGLQGDEPAKRVLQLRKDALPMALVLVMLAQLSRRRVLRIPSGFGIWMLFLAWVAIGVLVLWADAPGAVPGSAPPRAVAPGLPPPPCARFRVEPGRLPASPESASHPVAPAPVRDARPFLLRRRPRAPCPSL